MFVEFNYDPVIEDFDKNGKLKIGTILKILENSGSRHSEKAGDSILGGAQKKIAWVLTDWKIEIKKYPEYSEKIKAKTWSQTVNQIFNVSRDFELYSNDNLCATGTTRWVLLDLATGRPLKIENSLIEKYEPEDKSVFPETKLPKIPVPENFESETKIQIRRTDIDFNDHVHNLTYIDYALEALPESLYEKQNFSGLRITYRKPVKAGESIVARYACDEVKNIVCIFDSNNDLKTQIEFI